MRIRLCPVVILMVVLPLGTLVQAGDCDVEFREAGPYGRTVPHVFYDQAITSVPLLYPDAVIVEARRSDRVGNVDYSLVAFKSSASSGTIEIDGLAGSASNGRAWSFRSVVSEANWSGLLSCVVERVRGLGESLP